MKNLKFKLILIFFSLFTTAFQSFSQISDEIVLSIQSGNEVMLASYFNQNVELRVLPHDDVFSKSQTQQIVAGFFKANKPKQFSIIYQGGKDGSRYAIGNLITNTGTFRVHFSFRIKNKKSFIHQLKIEK